jgi:pSer/pThr/pTyr-binding forkhead associated (FHA) protein
MATIELKRLDGTIRVMPLTDKPVVIGRSTEANLQILDPKISRLHCGIAVAAPSFLLRDLNSTNGTYVNGERTTEALLKTGDKILIGDTYFDVAVEPPSAKLTLTEQPLPRASLYAAAARPPSATA